MKFSVVVEIFEKIEQLTSRNQIMELLAGLFNQSTPHEALMITNLSLGQVRATYQGNQFHIADKTLKKITQDLLSISAEELAALVQAHGDLGTIVATHKRDIIHEITLKQVFDHLIDLQTISGEGSQEERAQRLKNLLEQVNPAGAGFIIRIVLGKLRTGFSDMTIIDAFSGCLPAINRYAKRSNIRIISVQI